MTSVRRQFLAKPSASQIEITLLGPGYGESAVCHLGGEQWIIIDSCLDKGAGNEPASLAYLRGIGVDPSEAVRLIVATHFDDDHIRGLADTIVQCTNATVCLSHALGKSEFLGAAEAIEENASGLGITSGVREIRRIMGHLRNSGRYPKRAGANQELLYLPSSQTGHGWPVRIKALAPCDAEIDNALLHIAEMIPSEKSPMRHGKARLRNHHSVVVWIDFGFCRVLLGGDLEETSAAATGWSAVVALAPTLEAQAKIFKVPHHGSETGHSDAVWRTLLTNDPIALITPFSKSKEKLPTSGDVQRILMYANNAHVTADHSQPRIKKRDKAVDKIIRRRGRFHAAFENTIGGVRLRNAVQSNNSEWNVEYIAGSACHISKLL